MKGRKKKPEEQHYKKITITLPDNLLQEIKKEVENNGDTLSGFLRLGSKEILKKRKLEKKNFI